MNRMQSFSFSCLAMLFVSLVGCGKSPSAEPDSVNETSRKIEMTFKNQVFDSDWRFLQGDVSGAENPAFDDSS